jgi:predicted neutral ceramidase superfamily lipid hydrolase
MLAVLQSYGTFFNSNDFSKIYLGMVQFHLLLPGVFYTRLYLDHLALLILTSITKKFLRYIKSKKQESSGVATLEVDGCYMEDNKSKAEALNKQYLDI